MDYPEYEHIEILDSDVRLIGKATFEVNQDRVEHGIETSLESGIEISSDFSEFKILFNGADVTELLKYIEHEQAVNLYSQMKSELKEKLEEDL